MMLLKEIKEILGGDISIANSKMPGTSFGLATAFCTTGSALREIPGSVCEGCYAVNIEKRYPSALLGYTRRTEAVNRASKTGLGRAQWIHAFVTRLTKLGYRHHRWHDSGDLQSIQHLKMIVEVAEEMPYIQFWLPTKEVKLIKQYLKARPTFPSNLTVRVSAPMINELPKTPGDLPGSMVVEPKLLKEVLEAHRVYACPARHQGNKCQDCRACWDKKVDVVAYPKH